MLQGTYHPLLVTASVLIAVFASYTSLSLAQRILLSRAGARRSFWIAGGALVMGFGIWSMHFVGMLALSMPIPIGYDSLLTVASLLVAITASYLALKIGVRLDHSWKRIGWGGVLLGSGIAVMHYTGMAAMRMDPPIEYSPPMVLLAILVAVSAASAALWLFSSLGPRSGKNWFWYRMIAATLLGAGITSMHYIGMASAHIPRHSASGVPGNVDAVWLGAAIIATLVVMLTAMLILSESEARRSIREKLLAYADPGFNLGEKQGLGKVKIGPYGPSVLYLSAALAVVIVWASIAGMLMREHTTVIEGEKKALQRMALVVKEQARNLVSNIDFFLASTDRLLIRYPNHAPRDIPEFQALVRTLNEKYQGQVEVHFTDESGELCTDQHDTKPPLLNIYDQDYFPFPSYATAQGLNIGMPVWSEEGKKWWIPISYPLTKKAQDASVIVALLDVQALEHLYEQGRSKPAGSISLAHRNGTILARAPHGARTIGRSIAKGEIWTQHLPYRTEGAEVVPSPVVDGIPRITAYSQLPDFPLVAIASSDIESVLANWWKIVYGSVLFGLFLSFLILFAARRLSFLLSELEEAHDRVKKEAAFDALTGLPNRRMFHDRLDLEMTRSRRSGSMLALLFIDLDRFKQVNDSLGHETGDRLLKEAARRLRTCVRSTDTIARLGGDEFTVILSEVKSSSAVERVVQDILDSLGKPYYLAGQSCYISASIGITCYPQDAGSKEGLLKNADQAMYAAKSAGRNRWEFFTARMQESAHNRMQLLNDARAGLAGQQFMLHYQPIVDPSTGRIKKAEALIRWRHPGKGFISPATFIPVIEESELIMELGHWVFCEAARQVAEWRRHIDPEFQISINVSPAQFKDSEARMTGWGKYLSDLGIPGSSIVLEITEGLILRADESVEAQIRMLREAGMQFSLDDFGTGYSSLSYLKKFNFDFIKIDQSFVDGLGSDAEDAVVCESIIAMAHKLGIKVVAEGVESDEQHKLLVAMDCDYEQGFLFSRSLPADEFMLHAKRTDDFPLSV